MNLEVGKYYIGDPNGKDTIWKLCIPNGVYIDNKGREYKIDSGEIGIISINDLLKEFDVSFGQVIDFLDCFEISFDINTLCFGTILIELESSEFYFSSEEEEHLEDDNEFEYLD